MIPFLLRQKINKGLNQIGLAGLDDPRGLLNQVAFLIQNHQQFRSLLLSVEPAKRTECYESLKPRLKFEAKPLADYIIDAQQEAEAKKLPVWDQAAQKLIAFDDFHHKPKSLHELAQEAIAKAEKEQKAKGRLELVCRRCTFTEDFPSTSPQQSYRDAREKGWAFERVKGKDKALCPNCSKEILQ